MITTIRQLFIAIFAAAAVVTAHSSAAPSSTESAISPSPCIVGCASDAATAAGCSSFTNLNCICKSTAFQAAAIACLKQKCTPDEVTQALAQQEASCGTISPTGDTGSTGTMGATGATGTMATTGGTEITSTTATRAETVPPTTPTTVPSISVSTSPTTAPTTTGTGSTTGSTTTSTRSSTTSNAAIRPGQQPLGIVGALGAGIFWIAL